MFHFNEVYLKAIDNSFSLSARWSNTKRCIFKHARLIDHSFEGTLARFCHISDIDIASANHVSCLPPPLSLSMLLSALVAERTRFLEKYEVYRKQRNIDKENGKLQSSITYLRQLHAPDYYDSRCVALAPWRDQGKYGYIDLSSEFAITPQYDSAEPFVGETAIVKIQGVYYDIDRTGKIISTRQSKSPSA